MRRIRRAASGYGMGLTILEMLVVLLIITLLAALLTPIIINARIYAQSNVCASNLRQLHASLAMYLSDFYGSFTDSQSWPKSAELLSPYVRDNRVFICPIDKASGIWGNYPDGIRTSYYFPSKQMVRDLLSVDANPGAFACMLHGKCRFGQLQSNEPIKPLCYGRVQRVCIDGSIQRSRIPLDCLYSTSGERLGYGNMYWRLLSDKPCPPEYRYGMEPCRPNDYPF